MMPRIRSLRSHILIAAITAGMACGAAEHVAAQSAESSLGAALEDMEGGGPVAHLMRGAHYESNEDLSAAIDAYQQAMGTTEPGSRWGEATRIRLARCYLQQPSPRVAKAKTVLGALSAEAADREIQREQALWQFLLALHSEASNWLTTDASPEQTFDLTEPAAVKDWPIPESQWRPFSKAMGRLGERFTSAKSPEQGAAFFEALLQQTTDAQLHRGILKELASQRLAAGDTAAALNAARAYWLTTVENQGQFAQAIDLMASCLESAGAEQATVQAYRRWQMSGKNSVENGSLKQVRELLASKLESGADDKRLIRQKVVSQAEGKVNRARLHLLNGDLKRAVPLLRQAMKDVESSSRYRERALDAIRMALALHDGDFHGIDRYTKYLLAQKSGREIGPEKDPLKALPPKVASGADS